MLSLFNYTDYYLTFLYSMWYSWIGFKITQIEKRVYFAVLGEEKWHNAYKIPFIYTNLTHILLEKQR